MEERHVYELDPVPGTPKCATLASRMKENLNAVVEELDNVSNSDITDEEQFDLLAKLLGRLYSEFSTLSKKQPDAIVNVFKTEQVNRVLIPLKEMMKTEPSIKYLDLLQETDETNSRRSTYSDAVVIMSQFKTACDEFRIKRFGKKWDFGW